MKTYDYLIIDLLNIFHAHDAIAKKEDKSQNGIYGTIQKINKLKREYLKPEGIVYILSDNPTSKVQTRKLLDPEYKINRIERPQEFYKSLEVLALILQSYDDNYKYIQVPKLEADDLVPIVVENLPEDSLILAVSSDMDWSRIINYKNHRVVWHNRKEIVTRNLFEEKYGFFPSEQNVVTYKTFRGDPSDNIESGVPMLPTKHLFTMINFGSYDDIIENIDIIDIPDKWKEAIKERKARLDLNYQLVSFYPIPYKEMKPYIIDCKYKPRLLKNLYESLRFKIEYIDKRVDEFLKSQKRPEKKIDSFFELPKQQRI